MNKVSVIIPIYNVEKYLRRALDSLLSQTHQDWEAIMVDDGSTDGSASIARHYCDRDKRFVLTRQENQGQGTARNNALKTASGDYVMYLDPDDMLHPQAMEICVTASLRDRSDMVTFTYDHLYRFLCKCSHLLGLGDIKPRPRHYHDYNFHVTDNVFLHATESSHPQDVDRRWIIKHCQAWRCLLRADLARKAHFAEGVKYEDLLWWGEILLNVRRTTITRLPLYYYYPNPTGFILSADTAEHIRSLKIVLDLTDNIYEQATPEQRKAWNTNFRTPYQHYLEKKLRRAEKH